MLGRESNLLCRVVRGFFDKVTSIGNDELRDYLVVQFSKTANIHILK